MYVYTYKTTYKDRCNALCREGVIALWTSGYPVIYDIMHVDRYTSLCGVAPLGTVVVAVREGVLE